ncbi:hypothetical protein AVEN_56468-1 [Araneus ventricosus]|uniref:Uncharacterized protein n=1 Tax=Araneus ventricosus TaxID=182803 RepID=A0A4Y2T0R8_ARAVE|nr:hypothetical protein AVEN_56468-1 [Araneus ventricosus]
MGLPILSKIFFTFAIPLHTHTHPPDIGDLIIRFRPRDHKNKGSRSHPTEDPPYNLPWYTLDLMLSPIPSLKSISFDLGIHDKSVPIHLEGVPADRFIPSV